MPNMIPEFQAIAEKLEVEFRNTASLPHSGEKGMEREYAVREFIESHLPKRYSVGSGLIADQTSRFSKQQDVVIFDGFNIPVLRDLKQSKVFFAEQVLASIEVKSNLRAQEITDIIEKAASIRNLRRSPLFHLSTDKSLDEIDARNPIFVFAVAYTSEFSLESLRDRVQQYIDDTNSDWGVSSLLVLRDKDNVSGVITNASPQDPSQLAVESRTSFPIACIAYDNIGSALLFFYLQLLHALQINSARSFAPDYLGYAQSEGMGQTNISIGSQGVRRTPFFWATETLRYAHERTDMEVLDAFFWFAQFAERRFPGTYTNPAHIFVLSGQKQVTELTPSDAWLALHMRASGSTDETTTRLLSDLVSLLRTVSQQDTFVDVVGPSS